MLRVVGLDVIQLQRVVGYTVRPQRLSIHSRSENPATAMTGQIWTYLTLSALQLILAFKVKGQGSWKVEKTAPIAARNSPFRC